MKLVFLTLICSATIFIMEAQVDSLQWAQKGATWLYNGSYYNETGSFQYSTYGKYVYTSDSIIDNKPVKKIKYSYFTILTNPITNEKTRSLDAFQYNLYYYVTKDSIYLYNNMQFQLLYVFNSTVNSKWKIPKNYNPIGSYGSPCDMASNIDTNYIVVDSIKKISFSNKQFNGIYASGQSQPYWTIGNIIINNIGSLNAPLSPLSSNKCAVPNGGNGTPRTLYCYSDSVRGYINFSSTSIDCIGLTTSINELEDKPDLQFKIKPNPASNTLNFVSNFNNDIKSLKIFDLIGREYLSIQNYNNSEINVSNLPNGIYIVKVLTESNFEVSAKFIKAD